MPVSAVDTLIIGAGQAGLAMSGNLRKHALPHLVVERSRIAESWRTRRWDSLVTNGPAWHDRFPDLTFANVDPDQFATKDQVVEYFETYAGRISAPVRTDVDVRRLAKADDGVTFIAETDSDMIHAASVVVATGPFQKPTIPPIVAGNLPLTQIHSNDYRSPASVPEGAVLVIGAGSSGVQIADELLRAGRRVFLSVGPHNRPPRRYRGKDFCWWLGALGEWDARTMSPGTEHVTIAVSGARGGHTVDFRELAGRGMLLLGTAQNCMDGTMRFAPDLVANIAAGDANYRSVLDRADAWIESRGLDFPAEPEARSIVRDPASLIDPRLTLDLAGEGIQSIIWATGYTPDFGWIDLDVFDSAGRPRHEAGVSAIPGLYFLGLPWLSRRASAFIWGVWHDAEHLAGHIAARARATA